GGSQRRRTRGGKHDEEGGQADQEGGNEGQEGRREGRREAEEEADAGPAGRAAPARAGAQAAEPIRQPLPGPLRHRRPPGPPGPGLVRRGHRRARPRHGGHGPVLRRGLRCRRLARAPHLAGTRRDGRPPRRPRRHRGRRRGRRRASPGDGHRLAAAGLVRQTALPAAVAGGWFLLLAELELCAAVSLVLLVSAYETGDFLIGSGSTNAFEGPLAGGVAVLVVTLVIAALGFPPFSV